MGRATAPITLLIQETLANQAEAYFKLDFIASEVETFLPVSQIPKYERWRSFGYIKDQVRRVASAKVDGRRIYVAIPDTTGKKWWRRLDHCSAQDMESLIGYRDSQIDSLTAARKTMRMVLAAQRTAAEQGRVLTYGEALVEIDAR